MSQKSKKSKKRLMEVSVEEVLDELKVDNSSAEAKEENHPDIR